LNPWESANSGTFEDEDAEREDDDAAKWILIIILSVSLL
jgi:hypothetical protein